MLLTSTIERQTASLLRLPAPSIAKTIFSAARGVALIIPPSGVTKRIRTATVTAAIAATNVCVAEAIRAGAVSGAIIFSVGGIAKSIRAATKGVALAIAAQGAAKGVFAAPQLGFCGHGKTQHNQHCYRSDPSHRFLPHQINASAWYRITQHYYKVV